MYVVGGALICNTAQNDYVPVGGDGFELSANTTARPQKSLIPSRGASW